MLTFPAEEIASTMVETRIIVCFQICLAGEIDYKGVDKDKVRKDYSKIVKFLKC